MPRVGLLAIGLFLLSRPAAGGEKQLRPFVGVSLAGTSTFVLSDAAGKAHGLLGANAALVGDFVGVEADVGWGPRFFERDAQRLVLNSNVTTVTGSVIVTLPRRLVEYTLRPYFVAGAGLMRVRIDDVFEAFPVRENMPALNLGGGVIGFVTNRVGVAWDVRRLGSLTGPAAKTGLTIGEVGRLTFWRANMALVLRY